MQGSDCIYEEYEEYVDSVLKKVEAIKAEEENRPDMMRLFRQQEKVDEAQKS